MNKTSHFICLIFYTILLLPLLFYPKINQNLFISLNEVASIVPAALWAIITLGGDGVFSIAFLAFFIWKSPHFVAICLYCGLAMGIIVQLLKRLIDYERPAVVLEDYPFNTIGEALSYNAFPSGHTATIFFLAVSLITYFNVKNIKLLVFTIGIATLVGFSRIAVGVHFPSDVLFGAMLGWSSAWLGISLLANNRIPFPLVIIASVFIFFVAASMFFYDPKLPYVGDLVNLAAAVFITAAICGILHRTIKNSWHTID